MMPRLEIRYLGGNCPVQAEGTVDGEPFYFRARGSYWSMGIGGEDAVLKPEWETREDYPGGPFDAGWITEEEALSFIQKAVSAWAERTQEEHGNFTKR